MSREGTIRELQGHSYTYLSHDKQKFHKYYSYRLSDGWNVFYESSSVDGHTEFTKMFIPDELYEIFAADKAIKTLSE